MLQGKQYCMTPSKHSSGKRRSGVISILIRLIGAGCLWCALKALTEDLFKKSCLRGESMCTLINKTSYSCWRMGNSFMQSLTLKHLLVVDVVRTFRKKIVFFRHFSHANLKFRRYRTTATTTMELLHQVTLYLCIFERKTIALVVEISTSYRV